MAKETKVILLLLILSTVGSDAENVTTACIISDADRFFHYFFDAECLASGAVQTLECPYSAALSYWQKMAGHLKLESLLLSMIALMGYASLLLTGGVPKKEGGERKASGVMLTFLNVVAQTAQIVLLASSFLLVCMAYDAMRQHFAPCLVPWKGGSASAMSVVTIPIVLWHPILFQRCLIASVTLPSLEILTREFAPIVATFARRSAVVFSALWRAALLLQLVIWCVALAFFFGLAFVPISSAVLLCGILLHAMLKAAFNFEYGRDAVAWTVELRSSHDLAKVRIMCKELWGPVMQINTLIYFGLLGAVLSPTIFFGYWLAWFIYSGEHGALHAGDAFNFVFGGLRGFDLALPSWVDFAEFDLGEALDVLGGIGCYLEYEPGRILVASATLSTLQTVIGVVKGVAALGNAALVYFSRGRSGVRTDPFALSWQIAMALSLRTLRGTDGSLRTLEGVLAMMEPSEVKNAAKLALLQNKLDEVQGRLETFRARKAELDELSHALAVEKAGHAAQAAEKAGQTKGATKEEVELQKAEEVELQKAVLRRRAEEKKVRVGLKANQQQIEEQLRRERQIMEKQAQIEEEQRWFKEESKRIENELRRLRAQAAVALGERPRASAIGRGRTDTE